MGNKGGHRARGYAKRVRSLMFVESVRLAESTRTLGRFCVFEVVVSGKARYGERSFLMGE